MDLECEHASILSKKMNPFGRVVMEIFSFFFVELPMGHPIFVADTNNHRILQFHQNQTNGIVVACFGCSSLFLLNKPTSITFDGNSVFYVVDSFHHQIVRLLSNAFEYLFGCSNELNHPQSTSFDLFGNIFITDCNHHRILQFHPIRQFKQKYFSSSYRHF